MSKFVKLVRNRPPAGNPNGKPEEQIMELELFQKMRRNGRGLSWNMVGEVPEPKAAPKELTTSATNTPVTNKDLSEIQGSQKTAADTKIGGK